VPSSAPAFVFDLDGALLDSVYQDVLAWREVLEKAGVSPAVWRIRRRARPRKFSRKRPAPPQAEAGQKHAA